MKLTLIRLDGREEDLTHISFTLVKDGVPAGLGGFITTSGDSSAEHQRLILHSIKETEIIYKEI